LETRTTADFLSRGTWWLGGSLAALALIVNLFPLTGKNLNPDKEKVLFKEGKQVPTTPSVPKDIIISSRFLRADHNNFYHSERSEESIFCKSSP